MAFCAICGRHHEPGIRCFDGTGELLKEGGVRPPPAAPKEAREQMTKAADRWFLKMLLWAFVIIVLLYVVSSFVSKLH